MKYSILTFGCRVNQADSMAIERDLRARGAVPSESGDADVIVVNSCSVTATADQGTRQAIRRVARENPAARILVTGCYATRCSDDVAALPGVAVVVPNSEKQTLVSSHVPPWDSSPPSGTVPLYLLDRTAFAVRVQTGCEESCSYCVIPYTRGKSSSRTIDDLVAELRDAEARGVLQVILTGVHLGAYGRDLTPPSSLDALLRAVVDATSHLLIRIGSLEPMDVPPALVELAARGRIAPAFHLPLQHASNRILARMRRPYTLATYAAIVHDLRAQLPHAAIGSDVIVGFPGETDDDFARLCEYLESSPLTSLHVFPYSDRPGTEASSLGEKVPGPIVRDRGRRIREIGQTLAARFRESQAGSVRPALTIEDGSVAVTDNGLRVAVEPGRQRNQRVAVAISS
jgi:threonylcarbamoyladenosine tRNA methylthiotransferase MtaB